MSVIKCPKCGNYTTSQVVNSRPQPDGSIYRRRECLGCGKRYSTTETFDPSEQMEPKTMTEHFSAVLARLDLDSGPTPPSSVQVGERWWPPSSSHGKVWNGHEWVLGETLR